MPPSPSPVQVGIFMRELLPDELQRFIPSQAGGCLNPHSVWKVGGCWGEAGRKLGGTVPGSDPGEKDPPLFSFDKLPSLVKLLSPPLPSSLQIGQWGRLFWSAFLHADEHHLYYNMASFLWKVSD